MVPHVRYYLRSLTQVSFYFVISFWIFTCVAQSNHVFLFIDIVVLPHYLVIIFNWKIFFVLHSMFLVAIVLRARSIVFFYKPIITPHHLIYQYLFLLLGGEMH